MGNRRRVVQVLWAAATNSYAAGFLHGKIYKGKLKNVCVPGLNCYSCPGALGACPIGALQATLGSARLFHVACYALGFLLVAGALCGRFICGWLCPFGLIEELLYKIPFVKKVRTFRADAALRRLKYVILAIFVILLPTIPANVSGNGTPYFCMLICPAGTLEGGIPLVIANNALRSAAGWLFGWKLAVLAAVIVASLAVYRPFCKYLCPLGAIYALFNPVSLYRMNVDESRCVRCGACSGSCPMNIRVFDDPNGPECIRCGKCVAACPGGALRLGFSNPRRRSER